MAPGFNNPLGGGWVSDEPLHTRGTNLPRGFCQAFLRLQDRFVPGGHGVPAPAVGVQCPLQSARADGCPAPPTGPVCLLGWGRWAEVGALSLALALNWVTVQHSIFSTSCDSAFRGRMTRDLKEHLKCSKESRVQIEGTVREWRCLVGVSDFHVSVKGCLQQPVTRASR